LSRSHFLNSVYECSPKAAVFFSNLDGFATTTPYLSSDDDATLCSSSDDDETSSKLLEMISANKQDTKHLDNEQHSEPYQENEPNLPMPLHKLFTASNRNLTEEELAQLASESFGKLKVTTHESLFLEECTRGQSKSIVWFEYQKRLITASHFSEVLRH
jgi:hypothetical protein